MDSSTKQFKKRNAILSRLRQTTLHPSAEMLHEMLKPDHPDISIATVYRNLSRFKEQGVIQSLGTVNGIERFDGNPDPHVHFVCTCCSAVVDLHEMPIPQRLCREAAEYLGAKVDACQLMFHGTCRDCLAKNQTA